MDNNYNQASQAFLQMCELLVSHSQAIEKVCDVVIALQSKIIDLQTEIEKLEDLLAPDELKKYKRH